MDEKMQSDGPPGVTKDDIEYSERNPNLARVIPRGEGRTLSEQMEAATPHSAGTYPDIVEGSNSERTGTSWGVDGVEEGAIVETPDGARLEGTGEGNADSNRNTGVRSERDRLQDVGSWSTIETNDTAGSPTGNSQELGTRR